jgi:hypothetical protein
MKVTKEQFAQIIKETYRSLKESVTLDSIKKEMEQFDWSYDYSDDNRAYTSGRAHENEIRKMVKNYLSTHPNDKQKIVKMSDDIQRKKFNRSVFKGSNWINEANRPSKGSPDYHQHKIAVDTIKNPNKGLFMGGPSAKEAEETLRTKFKYSDSEIKKLRNESINEATVTSIPNFNMESDAYIAMLNALKSNNAFKKIVAKVGEDYYTGGNPKNLFTVLHGGLKHVVNDKIIMAAQAAVNSNGPRIAVTPQQAKDAQTIHKFAGVLALGVLGDLKDDPNGFPKMIGDPALIKAGSEFSVNRGKEKMGVIMGKAIRPKVVVAPTNKK